MKENKKQKIIQSALELFAEKGFEDTLIDSIAKKANVGKGTVYLYFKSKQELYRGIFEYILKDWENNIKSILQKDNSAREKLEQYIEGSICFIRKNKSVPKIVIRDFPHFIIKHINDNSMKKTKIFGMRIKPLEKIIKQGIKNGEFKKVDAHLMAIMIIGIINSYVFHYIILSEKCDKRKFKQVKKYILNCIVYKEEK